MLPRISAALIQHISPVASSGATVPEFEQYRKPKEEKEKPREKSGEKDPESPPTPLPEKQKTQLKLVTQPEASSSPPPLSLPTHPLVQLMSEFQDLRTGSSRLEGKQIYLKTLALHKKIGKSFKGVIVDDKIE